MSEMSIQKDVDQLHEQFRSLKRGINNLLRRLRGIKGISRELRKKLRDQRREIDQLLQLDNIQRLDEALPSLKQALLQLLPQLKSLQDAHEAISSLNQKIEGVVESLNSSTPISRALKEDENIKPLNKALKESGCEDVVGGLLQEGEHIDTEDAQGKTRLLKAMESYSEECVKVLLKYDANIYAKYNNTTLYPRLGGRTPSFLAAAFGYSSNPVAKRISDAFSKKRAELAVAKIKAAEGPEDGPSAKFNKASREAGCERMVEPLKEGEDIDTRDSQNDTRLLKAAKEGLAKCVKVLLDHGADIQAKNNLGETPLHKAAYEGEIDAVKVLIDAGADVKAVDNEGDMAAHETAHCRRHDGFFRRILDVYLAIAKRVVPKELARDILSRRNNEGYTAADIARRKCSYLVADLTENSESTRSRRSAAPLERNAEAVAIIPEMMKSVEGSPALGVTGKGGVQARNNNAVSSVEVDNFIYMGILVAGWLGLFKAKAPLSSKLETSAAGSFLEENMNRTMQHVREAERKYGSMPMR